MMELSSTDEDLRAEFYKVVDECLSIKRGDNSFYLNREKYNNVIDEVKEAKVATNKMPIHFRRIKRYDVLTIDGEEKLIKPVTAENPEVKYFVPNDELFQIIHASHLALKHGGRNRIIKDVQRKYVNISSEAVTLYLKLCKACREKKDAQKRVTVVKPMLDSIHNLANSSYGQGNGMINIHGGASTTEDTADKRILRNRFYEMMGKCLSAKRSDNNFYLSREKYMATINEVKEAKSVKTKTPLHYRRMKRYDVVEIEGVEKLIKPVTKANPDVKYFVHNDDLFEIIHSAHMDLGHGGRCRMMKEIQRNFANVPTESIMIYLRLCDNCHLKKKSAKQEMQKEYGNPILHTEMNSRCQIDFIDMQNCPDNAYRFILIYQDHSTKYIVLRPLVSKNADVVALQLVQTFAIFGAPNILHSDNGKEYVDDVISHVTKLWKDLKIVRGKSYRGQCQSTRTRTRQEIKDSLRDWMEANDNKKWSEGLCFIQIARNRSFHDNVQRTPFEAMFGYPMKMGIASSIVPAPALPNLQTEGDLENELTNAITIDNQKEIENVQVNAMEVDQSYNANRQTFPTVWMW